ncbi:ImmA/IrrE family metallo-endopeptidase [Agrococcus sp. 1P02AA]|uniref:ImmA/IrrE family metallo-endopeptidase n=1 Tax=Agrococcus sp. 1P02AA TaxID=3132259 RepID=UPI0039A5ECE7
MDLRLGVASLDGSSPTLSDLLRLCRQLGVRVDSAPLPAGWLGAYDHARRRILLTVGLTPVEERSVLAHELGHAVFMHAGASDAAERAAERFAARLLIDPLQLASVCAWARDDQEIAEALDVTPDVVRAYREHVLGRPAAA